MDQSCWRSDIDFQKKKFREISKNTLWNMQKPKRTSHVFLWFINLQNLRKFYVSGLEKSDLKILLLVEKWQVWNIVEMLVETEYGGIDKLEIQRKVGSVYFVDLIKWFWDPWFWKDINSNGIVNYNIPVLYRVSPSQSSGCLERYWKEYLRRCMCVYAKSFQLCPTLYDPMDWSPPDSSVDGILQAKIPE